MAVNELINKLITVITVAGVKRLVASVCDSLCVCVCSHDKTKTAETTISKLVTGIVPHESSPAN